MAEMTTQRSPICYDDAMNIYVSHSSNFDYVGELYEPLGRGLTGHSLYLPHDTKNNGKNSKDIIANSDLVLAEVSLASTGQGVELGWASAAGVPIICFYKSSYEPSGAISHIAHEIISYDNENDMVDKLTQLTN